MSNIIRSSFIFSANRFEEWQGGRCISQGPINATITAQNMGNSININIDGIESLRMHPYCSFSYFTAQDLGDRVQYIRSTDFDDNEEPIVCHLFYKGDTIDYVRFGMTAPDRIIEFYGKMISLGDLDTANGKPSRELIKTLIAEIDNIKKQVVQSAEYSGIDGAQIMQFEQTMELYKNPLRKAWEVYKYGWHSDFWDEGDSMFEYMFMFEPKAKEVINSLIELLSEQSPFDQMPGGFKITTGLLQVYRHLITQL